MIKLTILSIADGPENPDAELDCDKRRRDHDQLRQRLLVDGGKIHRNFRVSIPPNQPYWTTVKKS